MTGKLRKLVCVGTVCALAILSTGCGMFKGKNGGHENGDVEYLLGPAELHPGDMPMTEHGRMDDDMGVRVTDAQFDNVQFEYDKSHVRDSEMRKIEAVASYLMANPRARLVIDGHCDERGSREYNMALGEYRAQAVRANLIRLGVSPTRIQTRSYGSEQPLDPGHNEAAWRVNRRAEFLLYRD